MSLTDKQLFRGIVEQITISDFRSRPGDVICQVQMGKTFNITKQGKVVAVLQQPEETSAIFIANEIRRLGFAAGHASVNKK